jgi:serine/threonine protein phosphatase 1
MRWIIGDIHGMKNSLERLLEEVSRIDSQARFYFVGDYINRGPDSKGVIDLLLSLRDAKFVRGNHDDIFDQVLTSTHFASNAANGDRMMAFGWFMEFGLDHTFLSYGVDYGLLGRCTTIKELQAIVAAVPEAHQRFIHDLPPVIEESDLFVAHAKWDPYETDAMPSLMEMLKSNDAARHKLLWGRFTEEEIAITKAWRRTGYFGHTPVYAYAASQKTGEVLMLPIAGNKIVLLDTGVALNPNGRLTAFCADHHSFIQVDHYAKVVEVAR